MANVNNDERERLEWHELYVASVDSEDEDMDVEKSRREFGVVGAPVQPTSPDGEDEETMIDNSAEKEEDNCMDGASVESSDLVNVGPYNHIKPAEEGRNSNVQQQPVKKKTLSRTERRNIRQRWRPRV